jgi:hypothetical protein
MLQQCINATDLNSPSSGNAAQEHGSQEGAACMQVPVLARLPKSPRAKSSMSSLAGSLILDTIYIGARAVD